MLDTSVNEFIESASPGEDVVFVVAINEDADLSDVRRAVDQNSKIAAMKKAYAMVKAPRLSLFLRYRKDGLKVLNDMEGSSMFIVGGRADGWRKFLREQKALLDADLVSLIPNEQLAAIA